MGGAPSGYVKTFAGSGKDTILPTHKTDKKYYANGMAHEAMFFRPCGIAKHHDSKYGDLLVVAEPGSNRIRSVSLSSRDVYTFAGCGEEGNGDGDAQKAEFTSPVGIVNDPASQSVFVSDQHRIRRIKAGQVSVLAGTGSGGAAKDNADGLQAVFHEPMGMAVTANKLYVCDSRNHKIRMVDTKTGATSTVCGSGEDRNADGQALGGAAIWNPRFCAFDTTTMKPDSVLYISCADAIRRWDIETGVVTTVKGTSVQIPEVGLEPINPYGLVVTPSGILVAGCRKSGTLVSIDPVTAQTAIFVPSGKHCHSADGLSDENAKFDDVGGMVIHDDVIFVCGDKRIRRVQLNGDWFKGGKSGKDCRMCG